MQGTGADRVCPPLRGAVCRFGDGTTGSSCPTVCQLQAVSVDRVGGGLCREKRESMLLLYASTVNKQYHSICYSFTLIVLSAMALAHTDKPQKQQRIPFPALRNRTHIPVHKQLFP